MIKKRIGTDLFIWVEVYMRDSSFDFTDAEDIKVTVRHNTYRNKCFTQQRTISGNKLSFQINTEESRNMGVGIFDIMVSFKKPASASEDDYIDYILDMPRTIQLTPNSLDENGNLLGIEYHINYNNSGTDAYLQVTPELPQWVSETISVNYNIKTNQNWEAE